MQRRVLVACEKGPLGFDLIDQLLRDGCKVIVVGDLHMDSRRNLKGLSKLFNLELTKYVPLQPLCEITNFDQMYHLACPTRDQYDENPIQALESCFLTTKHLLDAALRCNARVVLANSAGSETASPRPAEYTAWDSRLRRKRKRAGEAAESVKPAAKRRRTKTASVPSISKSFYEEGNRLAEMLCSAYQQHFGLDVRIARLPDEYHPAVSRPKDRDVRILEWMASPDETAPDSADTTLVDSAAEDAVLQGLVDLMEAPSRPTATSNAAVPAKTPRLVA